MDLSSFHRFRTALEITASSEHEGEVLAAIRLANRLLKADGKTWTELLQGKMNATAPDKDYAAYTTGGETEEIIDMLHWLDRSVKRDSTFRSWVDNVMNYYEQHHSLTDGQIAALRRAYANRSSKR
jgi:hypothetical protein